MKPTTLIHYLRNKNRIISVLNELYGTEIPDTADVQYNECAFSGVPGYQSMLCCTIRNKVIIVSEEKFRVDRYNLVQMMQMFQNVLFQMPEDNLAQADVHYIILDVFEWARNCAVGDNSFAPYAFAEERNIISEAFDEWELEVFIQNSRNNAFENGCAETHRCVDEYRKKNWPARLKIYPSAGDIYYIELPDSYKGAEWDQVEKWVDEHLNTRLIEEVKPDEP